MGQDVVSHHGLDVRRQYNDVTNAPAALQAAWQPITAQVCHCRLTVLCAPM